MKSLSAARAVAAGFALALLVSGPAAAHEPFQEQSQGTAGVKVAIDLNTATQAQLEALPGVDPATAKRIIAGRPYTSVDELSKANVPPETIEKIRPMVKVSPTGTAAGGAARGAREGAKGVEKGARAGAKGVEKGATAAAKGTEKGIAAGTKGVEKGAEATGSAARKVREKLTGEPAKQPPSPGMVWVDADSGLYYVEGQMRYGRTKDGKWMTQTEASAAGYQPSKDPIKNRNK